MATIDSLIKRLMPLGTDYSNQAAKPSWSKPPLYAPDLFAVAATIVRSSECYTHPDVRGGLGLGPEHARICQTHGAAWRKSAVALGAARWIQAQWDTLRRAGQRDVSKYRTNDNNLSAWARAALRLMAVADEASRGVGFGGKSRFARIAETISYENEGGSVGWLVDQGECCVQPKGRTPPVGCNVRSLSLHLAILPSPNTVTTIHVDPAKHARRSNSLGVLLIPFPYFVRDSEFVPRPVQDQSWGRLKLRCSWGKDPAPNELAGFVRDLIATSRVGGHPVDFLVFPEIALSQAQYDRIWRMARGMGVGLFIAGVHAREHGKDRNLAMGALANTRRQEVASWKQSKHHRWRIERNQIDSYGLRLDRNRFWWEDIDVSSRTVVATRFTAGGTIACLVCEDLARVEPVQPALRELGPSLVVALLMDGPQIPARWSALSSVVFADDPGSSVLTLTSLGLPRRAVHARAHDGPAAVSIGLWREPGKRPVELCLAPSAHAVHLQLQLSREKEVTLDGRDDNTSAQVYRLAQGDGRPACTSITHDRAPDWAASLYHALA